jgi:hypothetical protein
MGDCPAPSAVAAALASHQETSICDSDYTSALFNLSTLMFSGLTGG